MPLASVIIPFSRPERVAQVIESVKRQKTNALLEIIVIGKKENFPADIEGVVCLKHDHQPSPGEARNMGARVAKGEILLFLDDDCYAAAEWLAESVEFIRLHPYAGAVGGRIVGISNRFFSRCTDYCNFWRQQSRRLREVDQLYAATMAVRRDMFFGVGGFAEGMKVGEDVDFVRRLTGQGFPSYYNPSIVVYHDHRRDSFPKFMAYMYANGQFTSYKRRICMLTVLPLALAHTGAAVLLNRRDCLRIALLMPFVFLGYLAYYFGIARHNAEQRHEIRKTRKTS